MDDFLYSTGYRQAKQTGLTPSEWEDCAAAFRLHMLLKYSEPVQLATLCRSTPAFARQCARYFALDQQRKIDHRHEWLWSQVAECDGKAEGDTIADPVNNIEALMGRIAFEQQIAEALAALSPVNRSYLRRRFHEQESYADMASTEGKKVNTVEQSVLRALKQLRRHLENEHQETQEQVDICSPPPYYLPSDKKTDE